MKRQTTLAMFGILFAAVMTLGMISVSGFSQSLFVASTDTKVVNHIGMMGHITFTTTDQDGNILSYIQTDNLIVNIGENCTAESLFNVTTTGAEACAGAGIHSCSDIGCTKQGVADGGFTYIAIGEGATDPDTDDTTLDQAGALEVDRQKDTSPDVTKSEGNLAGGVTSAVVTVSTIFTANGASDITESGLFDSAADGNMFARQIFPVIPLTDGDKLTVEWAIEISS